MKYNLEKHNRHSIRLKNYDYSQTGLYFVTVSIKEQEHLLCNIGICRGLIYQTPQAVDKFIIFNSRGFLAPDNLAGLSSPAFD